MIIVRSPLRVTLGGGGTDLPSYYREFEGFTIAAAIDKYVYVSISHPFSSGVYLKYSEIENAQQVSEIKHPIIREVLAREQLKTPQVEIAITADIPSGTGLGSSGSFTTALLKAVHAYRHRIIDRQQLAELACAIEIDQLHAPIGKQDQYIASFGGIAQFTFKKDDQVQVASLHLSMDTIFELEENLLLFFTGQIHRANDILNSQHVNSLNKEQKTLALLDEIKQLGYESKEALEQGDMLRFGGLLHKHWMLKRTFSSKVSTSKIDELYDLGMQHGALGGKIVGAGGGGFLLFYAADRSKLRRAMSDAGLEELRFRFDFDGTKQVLS